VEVRVFQAGTYLAVETLRDGRRLEIRALTPADQPGLLAAIGRSSAQSIYRRFFGAKRHFSEAETAFFMNVDFVNQVALVALLEERGLPEIVGGGRYVLVQPGTAELAFFVIDELQGHRCGADAAPDHDRPSRRAQGIDRRGVAGQRSNAWCVRKKRAPPSDATRSAGDARFAGAILTHARERSFLSRGRNGDPLMTRLILTSCLILSAIAPLHAQVMLDVAKITCDQFTGYKITNPQNIANWLSGYYNGKRGNTMLDTQELAANSNKLRDYCLVHPDVPVMQAVETVLATGK
jgi:hypothetical protein